MKRILTLASSTVAVQLLVVATQLVVDVVVARALGPEHMGVLVLAMSISGLLSIFLLFGSGEIAMRMYADDAHSPDEVLTASWTILARGVSATSALGSLVCLLGGVAASSLGAVALALAVLAVNGLSSTLNYVIVAHDRSGADLRRTLIARAVLVCGAGVGAWVADVHLVLAGYLLAALAHAGLRAQLVHTQIFSIRWKRNPEVVRAMWSGGKHVGFGAIFGTISNRSDMLVLNALVSARATGLYGAAYRVVTGAQTLAQASSFALFPFLNRSSDGTALVRQLYVGAALAGALFWVVSSLFAEAIVVLVYGAAFREASGILAVLLLATSVQWVHQYAARWLIAHDLQRALPSAQAVGCAVNLTCLAALVPMYGAMGAAWATLLADAAALVALMIRVTLLTRRSAALTTASA